jgi:hypothetical protein
MPCFTVVMCLLQQQLWCHTVWVTIWWQSATFMRAKWGQMVEIKQTVRRGNRPQTCAATVQLINVPFRPAARGRSCTSPRIVEASTRPLQRQCIIQTNAGRVGMVMGEGLAGSSVDAGGFLLSIELMSCWNAVSWSTREPTTADWLLTATMHACCRPDMASAHPLQRAL